MAQIDLGPNIQDLIDKHHESLQERPRPHMGVSMLGHPCERWLWLSFRWAVVEKFNGRILRLFRRGQLEEKTIVQDLRAIGMDIQNTIGEQSRVNFGCHVSGSIDGIIKYGVPEAPQKPHIAEFKTHSKKSFDDLEKHGVVKSKPVHEVQMQVYMLGSDVDRALYVAVCKDDDRIYTERLRLDKQKAIKFVERGKRIALSDRMPPPLSTDPSWYECKFCAAHEFCHSTKLTKQVNCRTCAHSTAKDDSTWHCAHWDSTIPVDAQHEGCPSHVFHPDLVPWRHISGDENNAVFEIENQAVVNGPDGYASTELVANAKACAFGLVDDLRKEFGAKVVG